MPGLHPILFGVLFLKPQEAIQESSGGPISIRRCWKVVEREDRKKG